VSISNKKWRFRIEHILEAIGKIQQYTAGMTEEGFAASQMAVDAVIRNFLVIGEATRHSTVSHGCPLARFRQINVLNTAAKQS
jgi:uncharacterized protein with HEPN domain